MHILGIPSRSVLLLLLLVALLGHYCCSTIGAYATRRLPSAVPALNINCGSDNGIFSDDLWWDSDKFYTGGTARQLPPLQSNASNSSYSSLVGQWDTSQRVFVQGDASCYNIPLPPGRYVLRLRFFLEPSNPWIAEEASFFVQLEGISLEVIHAAVFGGKPHVSEYIFTHFDHEVQLCFLQRNVAAFVNTIQLIPVPDDSYGAKDRGMTVLLNRARVSAGGPLVSAINDSMLRSWSSDEERERLIQKAESRIVSTEQEVDLSSVPQYLLPPPLFQSARVSGPSNQTIYHWTYPYVWRLHSWLALLYFSELNPAVGVGDRVFDVFVGDVVVRGFDIMRETKGSRNTPMALLIEVPAVRPTFVGTGTLEVSLIRTKKSRFNPIISAIELFELVPGETPREQVAVQASGDDNTWPPDIESKKKKPFPIVAMIVLCVGLLVLFVVVTALMMAWRRQHRAREQRLLLRAQRQNAEQAGEQSERSQLGQEDQGSHDSEEPLDINVGASPSTVWHEISEDWRSRV